MYSDRQINALRAIQAAVKEYGAKSLAADLGVSTGTLYADIDPNSIGRRTNKLGFLDWMVLLDLTGDLASLDQVNHIHNRISLPLPNPAEKPLNNWVIHCASIAKESGEAVSELADAILDGKMESKELARCEKETMDALEAFGALYLAIKDRRDQK